MARTTAFAKAPVSSAPMPQFADVHRGYIHLLHGGNLSSRTGAAVLGRLCAGGRPGGRRDGCAARDPADARCPRPRRVPQPSVLQRYCLVCECLHERLGASVLRYQSWAWQDALSSSSVES